MSALFLLSYVALWALVVLQALILVGITRALYEMRHQYPAAGPTSVQGRPVPDFTAVDLSGQPVSAASLVGAPSVLLFVSPNCHSCMVTFDELRALVSDPKRGLVVVCYAGDRACRRLAANYQLTVPVVADENGELTELFEVSATPAAVRISADGVIESYGSPVRGEELEQLLAGLSSAGEPTQEQTDGQKAVV